MSKLTKFKLILLLQILFHLNGFAQVTIQFIPELYGRNMNGLLNCRIINMAGRRTGTLSVTVSERKNGNLVVVRTAPFTINQGSNIIPVAAARNASVAYAPNSVAVIVKHNHDFPVGDYEYCFTLNFSDPGNAQIAEQCFEYQLVPFAQLNLMEPYDRDTICDKRPLLTWQPLLPGVPGASYQLVMAEVKADQNATEALNYNLPLINQGHINATLLPFPAINRDLDEGKTYTWQVTAYKDQVILNRSEIWTFKVQCKDQKPKLDVLKDDGYRDINNLIKGNYYIANAYLKFALINPYRETQLKYRIESLSKPGKKISGLPKIKLATGKNKVLIDLFNTDAFTDGLSYLLQLKLPDGSTKELRFIYKDQ
jgi:hypothetical protein